MTYCLSFMNLNTILSLVLFGCSLLFPLLYLLFDQQGKLTGLSEIFVKYSLFFNVGCLFIVGGAGQFLYGPEIASCIGWGWSPFQYELAFSEIALGVLGLIAPLFYREFWLSTIIGTAIWLVGASGVHLYYLIALSDIAILNASFVIGWNIFLTLWLIGLYCIATKPLSRFCRTLEVMQTVRTNIR